MTDTVRSTEFPEVEAELDPRVIRAIREDDIWMTALLLRDPNPIHFDLDAVASAGLGERPINQGGATMAYVIDYVASWAGSRARLRTIDCSFRSNVAAGDDVQVGARVAAVAPVDGGHLVSLDVWADVVGGRRALTGTAVVFRPTSAA